MKKSLAAITLLLAVLGSFQSAQALSLEGEVVNVVQDEEGANVMLDVGGGDFKSIYIPRSNANSGLTKKAVDALNTKTKIKISQ